MIIFFRLFWANIASRYGSMLFVIGLTGIIVIFQHSPLTLGAMRLLSLLIVATIVGTVLLMVCEFGFHSFSEYHRFMEAYKAGKKDIEYYKSMWPCEIAALKIAKKDIKKIESKKLKAGI